MRGVAEDRVPMFVRLPRDQAVALDRLVGSTGRPKQQVVSELLADHLGVGRVEFSESAGNEEVLTLEEAAALLRLPTDAVQASAIAGELPGRAFGDVWRFSRAAVMAWLAGTEEHGAGDSPAEDDERGR
jgi:excisionase family DNA binding protein